jgi:hypothetical protein
MVLENPSNMSLDYRYFVIFREQSRKVTGGMRVIKWIPGTVRLN